MKTERDFYVLALMVASVQGGSQALSRSLFASMIPKARSSEFFGFFSIFEKFGADLGPAAFELASRTTGSSRSAILSVVVFFIAGAAVLSVCERARRSRARKIERRRTDTANRTEDAWQRPQYHESMNPMSAETDTADENNRGDHEIRPARIHQAAHAVSKGFFELTGDRKCRPVSPSPVQSRGLRRTVPSRPSSVAPRCETSRACVKVL